MSEFSPPRTPTQRLQDSVSMHDMSTQELMRMVRDANHELHIRIDGLTPDGNDDGHRDFHRREQDREIMDRNARSLGIAQFWAGIRIGSGVLVVLLVVMLGYAFISK